VKRYAMFGIAVLTFFPTFWLAQEWPLLLVYFLGIGGLVMSIALNECSRCLNFDCGNCAVAEDVRREYLETPRAFQLKRPGGGCPSPTVKSR
jgi:hypothetical protein